MDISCKPSAAPISPKPLGKDRVTALQHLGCTFNEGDHNVTKVATPTVPVGQEEEPVPTFMKPVEEEKV
jgi:hypothetical protein